MAQPQNQNSDSIGIDPQIIAQVNQLTSTLSPTQQSWLGGYLTGIAAQGGVIPTTPEIGGDHILTILYGSQTGNARSIAEELNEAAQAEGIATDLVSMGKFKEKNLKKTKNVVVLVSTQGEGDPPDDALNFVDFLNGSKAPKLKDTRFAVCALGDSSYEFYCKTGKDFDTRLEELGGTRLFDRIDLDVDFDDDAEAWIASSIATLKELLPSAPATTTAPISYAAPSTSVKYTRKKPLQTQLLTNQKITGRHSEKDIRHIEINLEDSGLTYQAGDSLGVWFKNSPELVTLLLQETSIEPQTEIEISGEKTTLQHALEHTYELTQLHPAFVQDYAELTNNADLCAIATDAAALQAYIADRQIIDVIHEYPAPLTADALISTLRKLTPRLYSIASAQAEVEEEVHLTVGVVEYEAYGFHHLGGASGHLSQLQPGADISVYVEASDHFRLPPNLDTPIIMIGPGTGIAPFRAFVQERAATEATGDNWLFFGNPHFTEDFLYQTEWQTWMDEGILNKIDLAFSRDQTEKIYVQHRILEQAKELWNWIHRGAHIYICGDESRMAKDVHQALLTVIQEQGKQTPEQATETLDQLRRDGRYQKDVY
jgi:sulfite reductase (NADPH) flavoprotein alpha-component